MCCRRYRARTEAMKNSSIAAPARWRAVYRPNSRLPHFAISANTQADIAMDPIVSRHGQKRRSGLSRPDGTR